MSRMLIVIDMQNDFIRLDSGDGAGQSHYT